MRSTRQTAIKTSVPPVAQGESDHPFVNNVRFWSMAAIIAVHCICAWGISDKAGLARNAQTMVLPIIKFGTIGFYLISGFLLGERLPQYPAMQYLLRRVRTVGRPWAIWTPVFLCLIFWQITVKFPTIWQQLSPFEICLSPGMIILNSPYWFVPNFIVALAVLLVFRRFLNDLRFGAILLAISLLYGINVYFQWVPGTHTTAVFGFVFYLWLGAWASRNFEQVTRLLDRVSYPALLAVVVIVGLLSVAESHFLMGLWTSKPAGAFNTLRISNQAFTLLLALVFMKCRRKLTPSFANVRAVTFGQYLLHPICVLIFRELIDLVRTSLTGGVLESAKVDTFWTNPVVAVASWIALFATVYGTSLLVATCLSTHSRLSWMVGQRIDSEKRLEKRVVVRVPAAREMQRLAA